MTTQAVKTWTKDEVQALTHEAALSLFEQLPAATLQELDGEYEGFLLNPLTPEAKAKSDEFMSRWMGKAYQAIDDEHGHGYNRWRNGDNVDRWMRFGTDMGTSNHDSRPILRMRYAAFDNQPGKIDLVDEIRRLQDGLYLCIATVRAEDGGRTAPSVFGLIGPVGAWRGPDDANAEVL